MNFHAVWVVGELSGGRLDDASQELIGKARTLAPGLGGGVALFLLGASVPESILLAASAAGADAVLLAEDPALAATDDEPYAAVVASAARRYAPNVLLLSATPWGRALAPRIAALLHTGLSADNIDLAADPERRVLLQTKPSYGGELLAVIETPVARPQMATVRPGVFPMPEPADSAPLPEIIRVPTLPALLRSRLELLGAEAGNAGPLPKTDPSDALRKADIVVAGGRGMRSKEGFDKLRELARKLGAAVGATRQAVDAGWASPEEQIGQTGVTVSPRLYIAAGISGQIQHTSGIRLPRDGMLVTLNSDPDAPLARSASCALVGDAAALVSELLASL